MVKNSSTSSGNLTEKHVLSHILRRLNLQQPVPAAARSKTWVCGRKLAGIAVLNPARGSKACFLCVMYCQVEISATGRFLVQGSCTECVCVCVCACRINNGILDP
jgi:hypothetical protein